MQDSVELAAMLNSMTKSEGGWEKASPQAIAEALRAFELKRAPRCHDMVQLARNNGAMMCMKRSWLVRDCSFSQRIQFFISLPSVKLLLSALRGCCTQWHAGPLENWKGKELGRLWRALNSVCCKKKSAGP